METADLSSRRTFLGVAVVRGMGPVSAAYAGKETMSYHQTTRALYREAALTPRRTAYDTLHAMDYLEYAYLQSGQDAKAREAVRRVRPDRDRSYIDRRWHRHATRRVGRPSSIRSLVRAIP